MRLFESVGHLWDWLSEGKLDIAILPNCEPSPNLPFKVRQVVKEQIYLVGRRDDVRMPRTPCSPVGHPQAAARHFQPPEHGAQVA